MCLLSRFLCILQDLKDKSRPIKIINICPWHAPGVKDEETVAPSNDLFGQHIPKTKATPAGYTPYVPEGCGLIANKLDKGGGGLTWADCDEEDNLNRNLVGEKGNYHFFYILRQQFFSFG